MGKFSLFQTSPQNQPSLDAFEFLIMNDQSLEHPSLSAGMSYLACSYSLTDQVNEALTALERALILGYATQMLS